MENKKRLIIPEYLLPTIVHIALVALAAFVLRKSGTSLGYGTPPGIVLIIVSGVSSAFWGARFQCKHKRNNIKKIIRDYFSFAQPVKVYLWVVVFLMIDFIRVIGNGGFIIDSWLAPILLFLKAIIVGGIEEIGWRYTFQPEIERSIPYIPATCFTFICWGTWHILFFYIDGTLESISLATLSFFLLGLLTNCFILSALFNYSGSLWICVMTHALINMGAQLSNDGVPGISIVLSVSCIIVAILLNTKNKVD